MVGLNAATEVENAVRAQGRATITKGFARIEERIAGGDHAVGDNLTVVDFMLHTFWRWGVAGSFEMDAYPSFRRVAHCVEKLESVKATLALESIPLLFDAA